MKKIFTLMLSLTAALTLVCCSSVDRNVPAEPGEAAIYYFSFVREADFDSLIDGFYFGPEVPKAMIKMAKEMIKKSIMQSGGIDENALDELKNIQFRLLDSHAHDDDSAHVTLEVTNPEGEKNEATFDMKKIDGVWKIVVPM